MPGHYRENQIPNYPKWAKLHLSDGEKAGVATFNAPWSRKAKRQILLAEPNRRVEAALSACVVLLYPGSATGYGPQA